MSSLSRGFEDSARARAANPVVKIISINGDEATAILVGNTKQVTLTKEAGRWLISSSLDTSEQPAGGTP